MDFFVGAPFKKRVIERQLFQNVTVFWDGYILFFRCFFRPKKQRNVRFQTNFQGKAHIIERQFSQNVTVFYARYSVFFNRFLVNKEQNVRFQVDFQAKPLILEQFFENVTVLYDRVHFDF